MTRRGAVRVGCSGWLYKHWRGDFYPADLPERLWFEHYAKSFDTVEVNNTFYRLPTDETLRRWRDRAPVGFRFSVKVSRFLTHVRRLREPAEPLERFFSRVRALGATLGAALYQLPPRFHKDLARLGALLAAAPRDVPQALEARDASWYDVAVERALAAAGMALCLHDMPGSASGLRRIGPFVYARFHGTEVRYRSGYTRAALTPWADFLAEAVASGADVWAYFNNDSAGHAPRDAIELRDMLEKRL